LPIHHERTRERNASEPLGRLRDGDVPPQVGQNGRIRAVRPERFLGDGVEDAVPPDRRGADVREQRIGDAVPFAEVGKRLLRVVADRGDADPAPAELLDASLQLDELRTAERSPVRGADEHEHRATRAHDRLQVPDASGVIGESEIGDALADLRTELRDVDRHTGSLRLQPGHRQDRGDRKGDELSHSVSLLEACALTQPDPRHAASWMTPAFTRRGRDPIAAHRIVTLRVPSARQRALGKKRLARVRGQGAVRLRE
jgi:hypothetical protein